MAMTSGERVLSEFWRLFEVEDDLQDEADRVLEKYLQKRVRDMMYQARVEAVKLYHRKQGQEIDDALARSIELEYEQYMDGQLKWCNDEVWPELCTYWWSKAFMVKRKRGQGARSSSEDIAQNRVLKTLLKTMEGLDHSSRHNKFWKPSLDPRRPPR